MEKFYVSYISTVSVSDKIFGKKYENQAKLKKSENFDICFRLNFDRYS